jgi:hypothetical protein
LHASLPDDLRDTALHDYWSDSDLLPDPPPETVPCPPPLSPRALDARVTEAFAACGPDPEWDCAEGEALMAFASDMLAACPFRFDLPEYHLSYCVTAPAAPTVPSMVHHAC